MLYFSKKPFPKFKEISKILAQGLASGQAAGPVISDSLARPGPAISRPGFQCPAIFSPNFQKNDFPASSTALK